MYIIITDRGHSTQTRHAVSPLLRRPAVVYFTHGDCSQDDAYRAASRIEACIVEICAWTAEKTSEVKRCQC